MKNEKGVTVIAMILVGVLIVVIAGVSWIVFKNGRNSGSTIEELNTATEIETESGYNSLMDEEDSADPEIDADKELEDADDSEVTEDEELENASATGGNTNTLVDPDAGIEDENV